VCALTRAKALDWSERIEIFGGDGGFIVDTLSLSRGLRLATLRGMNRLIISVEDLLNGTEWVDAPLQANPFAQAEREARPETQEEIL